MIIEGLKETIEHFLKADEDPLSNIMGQTDSKKGILASVLAGHHVLIEGPPGVGKTTLARQLAAILPLVTAAEDCPFHCNPEDPVCPSCLSKKKEEKTLKKISISGPQRFVRIQGSPDLTAEDLLGDIDPSMAFKHGPHDWRAFTPGKLLKGNRGIVFFDELNRIPEKLQNALLQVLEEHTATIGPYDLDYAANFLMIATMNPREHAGVEELSDVLLDRFDVVTMSYPENHEIERTIVKKYGKKIDHVNVPDGILDLVIKIIRSTREEPWNKDMDQGASVRAGLALYEKIQAYAWLESKEEVAVDHIRKAAVSTMTGRIKTSPESKYYDDPIGLVEALLKDMLKGE